MSRPEWIAVGIFLGFMLYILLGMLFYMIVIRVAKVDAVKGMESAKSLMRDVHRRQVIYTLACITTWPYFMCILVGQAIELLRIKMGHKI